MRKLLTIAAIAVATLVAGNANAQWWDASWGGSQNENVDVLGILDTGVRLNGQDQFINHLYFGGNSNTSVTSENTTNVNTLWVTSDTIKNGTSFQGNGATITNFNLYVGEKEVLEKNYGIAETNEVVTLNEDSIQVGNTTVSNKFGSWDVNGRSVVNEGSIGQLNYNGGTYSGSGEIGTLVAGTSLAGSGFTRADKITFASNGSGLLLTSSSGNYNAVDYGIVDYFGNVQTPEIDFTGANVRLSLSGFEGFTYDPEAESGRWDAFDEWVGSGNTFNFDFASVFDLPSDVIVSGTDALSTFAFYYGIEDAMFNAYANGQWATGWSILGGVISYTATESAVPEPATLAILGLGLTGLGVAARRRRK